MLGMKKSKKCEKGKERDLEMNNFISVPKSKFLERRTVGPIYQSPSYVQSFV
jgi:hypothetical protein